MTVDVIIVNWNGGAELVSAAQSVLRFGGRPIVVDNASTRVDALDEVARIAGVSVIRNPRNPGFAAGCNTGAAAGSGDVVMLLNPDAQIVGGTAADLEAAFHDTGATLLAVHVEDSNGTPISTIRELPRGRDLVNDLLRLSALRRRLIARGRTVGHESVARTGGSWVVGAAVAMPRRDWERLGGMDEHYFLWYEDVDLGTRVGRAGGTVALADKVRVRHVGGSTWRHMPRRQRQWLRLRGTWRYSRTHLGWAAISAVAAAALPALTIGVGLDAAHWLTRRP